MQEDTTWNAPDVTVSTDYVLTLTATDNLNREDSDTITITVVPIGDHTVTIATRTDNRVFGECYTCIANRHCQSGQETICPTHGQ